MNETRYLISDASHMLNVEPHVLRYWEEELGLEIRRNQMGHRYYTDEDIRVLKAIQEMKDQGILLKAIKQILPDLYANPKLNYKHMMKQETSGTENKAAEHPERQEEAAITGVISGGTSKKVMEMKQARQIVSAQNRTAVETVSAEFKMEQFQEIMTKIIGKALEANNRSLSGAISNEVSDKVSERIIKQMDYTMRENEERQEERFRKLDEAIRSRQKANAEAAAALEEANRKKKKRRLFGKPTRGGRNNRPNA